MMNIKAGQAVRVDSTLSARGAKKELSDQYFLCENLEAEGVEADYSRAGRGWSAQMSTGLGTLS